MNQPPQRLKDLFDLAKHSIGLPIRFTRFSPTVSNTSAVEVLENEVVIAVRDNLPSNVEENTIAHELMHVILQSEGFAAMTRLPEGALPMQSWLGPVITSCVDDAVVDRRLHKFGFSPDLLNHLTAEELPGLLRNYPAETLKNPVMRDGSALLIVCYSFRLVNPGDQIEGTWTKVSPEVAARSRVLAGQIGDIACDEAESCLKQKKHIRDVLGYPVRICNPRTCESE